MKILLRKIFIELKIILLFGAGPEGVLAGFVLADSAMATTGAAEPKEASSNFVGA